MKDKVLKDNSVCFDVSYFILNSIFFKFDENFGTKVKAECYFKYDFNKPEDIPNNFHGNFDMAVIDPPFITKEVW